MRGTKAKRLRRERVAQGLPPFAVPEHNITDLEDTHRDRRLKKCRPKEYARQLKESDPKRLGAERRKWSIVLLYLTAPPNFRPYLERFSGDPTQESRQETFEQMMEERNRDLDELEQSAS